MKWKMGFFIMTGMFLALLFYTVVLSLQTRQYLMMTLKQMKVQMQQSKSAVMETPVASDSAVASDAATASESATATDSATSSNEGKLTR